MTKVKYLLKWLGIAFVIGFIFIAAWYKFGRVFSFVDWAQYESSFYLEPLIWWGIFVPFFLVMSMTSLVNHNQIIIRQKSRQLIFRSRVIKGSKDALLFVGIIGIWGLVRLSAIQITTKELKTYMIVWGIQLILAVIALIFMYLIMLTLHNWLNRIWLAGLITSLLSIVFMSSDRLSIEFPWRYFYINGMLGNWPNTTIMLPYFMMILWIIMSIGVYLLGESKAKLLRWY